MLSPSIMSRLFGEGVTETVVPGHTRTSPPRARCRTSVSDPAVTDDPEPSRLPASTSAPAPPVTGTTAGAAPIDIPAATGGTIGGDFLLPAFTSSAGLRRIINRLPAPSQVKP